ncbi:MAG: hypothetical protein ABIQ47_13750 [Tepidiformaceae bacterium]
MSQITDTPAPANSSAHTHHWRIEEANGPVSYGRCKGCGGQKEFRNWLLETDFTTRSEHELAA